MVLVILFSEFILKKKQNQRKRKNKTYNPKKNKDIYIHYFFIVSIF
jgi:hypothetical protein